MTCRFPFRAAVAATIAVLCIAIPVRADEPAAVARQLYERFAGGDVEGVKRLMADGPAMARLKTFAGTWRARCVSLGEFRAGDVRLSGERAEVPVVASFAKLDPVSGRQSVDLEHALVGMKRAGHTWKVDSWTFEEDALAEAYSMLVDLLVEDGHPREALLVAERAKGRTLLDILDRVRSRAEADAPAALLGEERRLEQPLVEANTKGDRAVIARARLELETQRSLIDANRPRLRASRGAGELPSIDSLAPLLNDARAAIVEYVAGEKRLHIFVVRHGADGPRVSVRSVPIPRRSLERLAKRYVNALSAHDLAYFADARRLHEILLAPVAHMAPQTRDLCIIPDGALWSVPFGSLIDGRGAFAIESRSFFYAPSAAVLLREHAHATRTAPGNRLFLGFGNPLLDTTANTAALTTRERAASNAPIPEAAREVETIARIVGPQSSEVFTGAEALESRAKAEASRFRIVHFATHGVIDDANPMYSHLLLSRRDGDGEDGALEAREMLDLHLNADLVVLSACDTARGDVHGGEGLIGMSWALFVAGSPSVIASEWRVGSARTETLMTTFYREWRKRQGQPFAKARALRAARLSLLRAPGGRHPYYWSPFVLIGSAD
jgi:CHAT domain-containing protein